MRDRAAIDDIWKVPVIVTLVELTFPSEVIGKFLPRKEDIPSEFFNRTNKWSYQADLWFAYGVNAEESTVEFKDHLDSTMQRYAVAQIQTCLASFGPKHEHKIAGVGYLMSLFFEVLSIAPSRKD